MRLAHLHRQQGRKSRAQPSVGNATACEGKALAASEPCGGAAAWDTGAAPARGYVRTQSWLARGYWHQCFPPRCVWLSLTYLRLVNENNNRHFFTHAQKFWCNSANRYTCSSSGPGSSVGLAACTGSVPTRESAGSRLYASQVLSLCPAAAGAGAAPRRALTAQRPGFPSPREQREPGTQYARET